MHYPSGRIIHVQTFCVSVLGHCTPSPVLADQWWNVRILHIKQDMFYLPAVRCKNITQHPCFNLPLIICQDIANHPVFQPLIGKMSGHSTDDFAQHPMFQPPSGWMLEHWKPFHVPVSQFLNLHCSLHWRSRYITVLSKIPRPMYWHVASSNSVASFEFYIYLCITM